MSVLAYATYASAIGKLRWHSEGSETGIDGELRARTHARESEKGPPRDTRCAQAADGTGGSDGSRPEIAYMKAHLNCKCNCREETRIPLESFSFD